MPRALRTSLLALLLVALAGALVAACGDEQEAASQDVDALLRDTFSGDEDIDSAHLKLAVAIDARGAAQFTGPVDLTLAGPFETTGANRLPKFDFRLRFSGAGQNLQAGAVSTGEKGFVSFQDRDYEVGDQLFEQFKAAFEEAQQRQQRQGAPQSLATLGIDPRRWLVDPTNEGEAKVGDEDTIKITGDVDVPKLLEDVNRAIERAGSLGGAGAAPRQLGEAQKRQVQEAVKALDVEIHTGADDRILRRMLIDLKLEAPRREDRGIGDAAVRFDLTLTDVNEGQDIEEPDDPRPFRELADRLGGLGLGLGGLGGAGGRGGSKSGGASAEALERYADCIRAAGSDSSEAQKCAALLTP